MKLLKSDVPDRIESDICLKNTIGRIYIGFLRSKSSNI